MTRRREIFEISRREGMRERTWDDRGSKRRSGDYLCGIANTGWRSARDSTWSWSPLRPSPSRFPRTNSRGDAAIHPSFSPCFPLCFPLRPARACAAIDSACSRRNTGPRRCFSLRNAARKSSCSTSLSGTG